MPRAIMAAFADRLSRACGHPVYKPADGKPVVPGTVYRTPGGRHMMMRQCAGLPAVAIDDGPPLHSCKPAVDPLFASAIPVYRGAILAVVLIGMGSGGAKGTADIVAGGIVAQDAASSVVWGMPGAVANAGLCSAILPLQAIIAPTIARLVEGRRA